MRNVPASVGSRTRAARRTRRAGRRSASARPAAPRRSRTARGTRRHPSRRATTSSFVCCCRAGARATRRSASSRPSSFASAQPLDLPVGAARLRDELEPAEIAVLRHQRVRREIDLRPRIGRRRVRLRLAAAVLGVGAAPRREAAAARDREPREPRDDPSVRRAGARRGPGRRPGDFARRRGRSVHPLGDFAHPHLEIGELRAQRIELVGRRSRRPASDEPGILSPGLRRPSRRGSSAIQSSTLSAGSSPRIHSPGRSARAASGRSIARPSESSARSIDRAGAVLLPMRGELRDAAVRRDDEIRSRRARLRRAPRCAAASPRPRSCRAAPAGRRPRPSSCSRTPTPSVPGASTSTSSDQSMLPDTRSRYGVGVLAPQRGEAERSAAGHARLARRRWRTRASPARRGSPRRRRARGRRAR